MKTVNISFLEKKDILGASRVLSQAMLKNPLHVAVFQGQGENERKRIQNMFLELFNELPGITFLARIDGEMVGVMRMKSCEGKKASHEFLKNDDLNSLEGRKSVWLDEWDRRDPSDPHWHLGPVGVLPSYQGSGIGTKLLKRFCHEVDACAAPAFLETDTDNNVRFYRRFGFDIVAENEILHVKSRYMWRTAVTCDSTIG